MKRRQKIFSFLMLTLLMLPIMTYSQETFTKFRLSGFDVKLIQSDKYAIEINETFEVKKEVINGVLSIQVLDQTGPIPKSLVTIYTNQINYLELHNCKITTETLISTDSLTVELSSSFGSLNSNSKSLTISAGGGVLLL